MTPEQHVVFAAHIRANTDAGVVAALAVRDDQAISDWYNQSSSTKAWRQSVQKQELFNAMNLATFDSVVAGKRDAWKIMLDMAPLDFTKASNRKGVVDIFATADATKILTACTENALQVELVFGGESKTSGSVTALNRNYIGATEAGEVLHVLNNY